MMILPPAPPTATEVSREDQHQQPDIEKRSCIGSSVRGGADKVDRKKVDDKKVDDVVSTEVCGA